MKYQIGDQVVYISECADHDHNERGLTIGEVYTISALSDNWGIFLEEPHWWVKKECVVNADEYKLEDPNFKYRKVIKKIKQLEKKFEDSKKKKDSLTIVHGKLV